jgi:RNA polymerase sigma-70 factor (ECF subfamily)
VEAIFSYFARRLGEDSAEDLTADVFLKAFDKRARYDRSYPDARPWLYGIAANLLRRHRRAEERRLRAYAREAGRRPAAHDDDDARLDCQAARPALAEALAALSADEREALLLYAWVEMSYEEIARTLGVPVGTVSSRLNRARRRVRHALGASPSEHSETNCAREPELAVLKEKNLRWMISN